AGEAAVHRVVAQQMRVGFDRSEIVQRNDVDILAAGFGDSAQDVAPDAAKSVDSDPDGHGSAPSSGKSLRALLRLIGPMLNPVEGWAQSMPNSPARSISLSSFLRVRLSRARPCSPITLA